MTTTMPLTLPHLLYAMGDPVRLAILHKLAAAPAGLSCGDLCPATPRSTLTHHLKILRESGLITTEKQGQTHINRLHATALESRFPGLLATILRHAG